MFYYSGIVPQARWKLHVLDYMGSSTIIPITWFLQYEHNLGRYSVRNRHSQKNKTHYARFFFLVYFSDTCY